MTDTATETRTVVVERTVAHPPERVWRAITQSALIEEWLMKNDFEPRVGHVFQLRSEPAPGWDGVIDCKVLAIEPPSRLSYTWGTMGMGSVVTLTLTPTDGGTQVRVEQAGFRPDQTQNIRGAQFGWTRFLGQLESVVAKLD